MLFLQVYPNIIVYSSIGSQNLTLADAHQILSITAAPTSRRRMAYYNVSEWRCTFSARYLPPKLRS